MAEKRKTRRASDAEILGLNKRTGKRTLQRGKRYSQYTVGNHIRTSAKVGNIYNHLNYASTDSTPYFVSTLSRYTALRDIRTDVVSKLANSEKAKYGVLANKLADKIAIPEENEILTFAGAINGDLGSSSDQVVMNLNSMALFVDGRNKTIQDYVNDLIDDLQTMYFRFIDSKGYQKTLVDQIIKDFEKDDIGDLTIAPTAEQRKGGSRAYRKEENTLKNYERSVSEILNILQSDELKMNDLLSVSQAMSFMYQAGAQSVGQTSGEGYADLAAFGELHKSFRDAAKKVEADIEKDTSKVSFKRGRNNFGIISEFATGYALMRVLQNVSSEHRYIKTKTKSIALDMKKGATDFGLEVLSGAKSETKGADYAITHGLDRMYVDSKQVGAKRAKKAGGLLYDAGTTVDFSEAFRGVISGKATASASVVKMYRAVAMNISANEGYNLLGRPEERLMLFNQSMTNEEVFDNKFFSDAIKDGSTTGHGYPVLVSVNGKFFKFSDVVRKIGDTKDFEADIDGSKGVELGSTVSTDAGKMYRSKMDIGKGKRMPGFSEQVPEVVEMARRVESTYNRENRRRVRFIINLR